jgi:hypothetical protein
LNAHRIKCAPTTEDELKRHELRARDALRSSGC